MFLRKGNSGEASAKNAALRAASGEFLVILDGDDVYMPERPGALSTFAQARPDLDILRTDGFIVAAGRTVRRARSRRSALRSGVRPAVAARDRRNRGRAGSRRAHPP